MYWFQIKFIFTSILRKVPYRFLISYDVLSNHFVPLFKKSTMLHKRLAKTARYACFCMILIFASPFISPYLLISYIYFHFYFLLWSGIPPQMLSYSWVPHVLFFVPPSHFLWSFCYSVRLPARPPKRPSACLSLSSPARAPTHPFGHQSTARLLVYPYVHSSQSTFRCFLLIPFRSIFLYFTLNTVILCIVFHSHDSVNLSFLAFSFRLSFVLVPGKITIS